VVATAIRQAALGAQIALVEEILAAQRQELAIAEKRYDLGGVALVAVRNQGALVAQTAATLPPLRAQYAQASHFLAVLMGDPPAAATFRRSRWRPCGFRTRFRCASRLNSCASARISRRARRCSQSERQRRGSNRRSVPKIRHLRWIFVKSAQHRDVLGNGINIWNIGINLLQPLFRGGELQARKRAAEAGYEQALAAYRQTVLQGLQNVADVLRALEADADAVSARSLQADRAERRTASRIERFRAGGVSEVTLIDAGPAAAVCPVEQLQARAANMPTLPRCPGSRRELALGVDPRRFFVVQSLSFAFPGLQRTQSATAITEARRVLARGGAFEAQSGQGAMKSGPSRTRAAATLICKGWFARSKAVVSRSRQRSRMHCRALVDADPPVTTARPHETDNQDANDQSARAEGPQARRVQKARCRRSSRARKSAAYARVSTRRRRRSRTPRCGRSPRSA
jgi:hypothetical protein